MEKLKGIIANIFAFGICLFVADISFLMAQQIDISVTGSWTETIDASDLQGEPGTDLVDTYTSAEGQVSVSINKVVYGNFWDWFINYNWRVDVRRSDFNWYPDLTLWVRRTGGGFGFGSVSGGTSFREITSMDWFFFSGSRRRIGMPLQFELRNVSVQVPSDDYSTMVIYTVVEL